MSTNAEITTSLAAEACDALLAECLNRGTVDNISVILVVLNTPVIHHPVAEQHQSSVVTNLYQQYYPHTGGTVNSNVSASSGNSGNIVVQRRLSGAGTAGMDNIPKSPRVQSFSVDMSINSSSNGAMVAGISSNGCSLTATAGVFGEGESESVASPLNTMAGSTSGRVRKQLQFTDDL